MTVCEIFLIEWKVTSCTLLILAQGYEFAGQLLERNAKT